ncbi:MAG: Betaine-aldehyde dehydrogenase [Acidimicrobiaceae bacterium]|nr:Betaine-aldehyde dehydrogenase [Acidimicrobiaceae bacterium]
MSTTAPEPRLEFLESGPKLYIDGAFIETGASLETRNPATGAVLAEVPVAGQAEVDAAVAAASCAFEVWRSTSPVQRASLLWKLGDLVDEHLEELAVIEVLDNGKPIGEARAVDMALTAEIFRYYAGWTTKISGTVYPNSVGNVLTMGRREPIGVVAAITPWNFPLLEVAYKLGPALAAGCTVVVKPSELAPLSSLRLAQLIADAGFPPGVVNIIVGGPEVGAALVRHPDVRKIAFTGQTATGKTILRSSADDLKAVSLELGGKSPNIVFADADFDKALAGAFGGIFFNQGQACVAGSRLFAEAPVLDQLVEKLSTKASSIRLGHGLAPGTEMGPLISSSHRARVLSFIDSARGEGAEVVSGGAVAEVDGLDGGFFLEPTLITSVSNSMRVAQEEIFGPVLSVIPWTDPEELEHLANDVPYGLAAGIWTSDVPKALRLAERLEAGTVWINTYGMFDVAVPFGGRKESGFGKELGAEALEPYLQSKSIWLDLDAAPARAGQSVGR